MSQSPRLPHNESITTDKQPGKSETEAEPQPDTQNATSSPSLHEDEDNNPFLHHHQGLSSFSHLHLNNSSQQHEEVNSQDIVDDSMLLYKTSKLDKNTESFNTVNMNFESRVTKLLKPKVRVKIQITEAGNSNEGMNNSLKKYIVYTIKLVNIDDSSDEVLTRRRYSDFESLRDVLTKIFPLVIIPPIPPKNYFDFSVFNGFVGQGSIGFGSNNGVGINAHDRSIGPVISGAGGGAGAGGVTRGNGSGSGVAGSSPPSASANSASSNTSNIHTTTTSASNNLSNPTSSYSYINSNHLAKSKLIEHRKRLLSNFLNNCLEIKQIRCLEFFHKFLDPNANWSDEIALIQNQLPKSIYLLNPENGLKTDAIYANLPNPSSKNTISFFKDNGKRITKRTNKLIGNNISNSANAIAAEATGVNPTPDESSTTETLQKKKQSEYIVETSGLDEVNKRITNNFMALSNDYAELGSVFNSFSLMFSETFLLILLRSDDDEEEEEGGATTTTTAANGGDSSATGLDNKAVQYKYKSNDNDDELNFILDKIGQCFDRSYIAINSLIGDLETQFSEPLGEAVQYTQTLHYITKFQSRKLTQKQMLDDEVKHKRKELNQLLKIELEAGMVEHAIRNQHSSTSNNGTGSKFDLNGGATTTSTNDKTHKSAPNGTSEQQNASTSGGLFKLPSFKFKTLTRYVSEIIDQNPQQTRRTKIHDLTDKISILEKCQDIMLADLSFIYDEVDKNLQQFQIRQLKMIYEILLYYNQVLVGWAKKNVEIWQDVREEIIKY